MISGILESALSSASSQGVTDVFLIILAITFAYAFYSARNGKARRFVAYTPNLLTSIGILGTFVGIVIGLMAFDPGDIDGSITLLLEGLKTAFTTSLAGMFLSIVFKVYSTRKGINANEANRHGEGRDVGPMIIKALETQTETLEKLRNAIAGDEESSLAGQMKLFRSDTSDQHKLMLSTLNELADRQEERFATFAEQLGQQMEDFAEMLSKSATEQVIQALKDVITDFNNNLTEQFGDNFKALDASVRKLVDWQENYRHQLEDMHQQYEQGVKAISATEASVAHISEESHAITRNMGELHGVLEINQHQLDELNRHLAAFAEMRDKAVEAVPTIDRKLDEMTTRVTQTTNEVVGHMNESNDKLTAAIEKTAQDIKAAATETASTLAQSAKDMEAEILGMNEALKTTGQQVIHDTGQIHSQVSSSLEQLQRQMESSMEEILRQQTQSTAQLVEGLKATMQEAVTRTGEKVNDQLNLIDESMQKEINRVMEQMGQALASITGQFTKDYRQLVRAMNNITHEHRVSA